MSGSPGTGPADVTIGEPLNSGLARLEAMASDLEADWAQARDRILGLLDARPWGDGPEGTAFERALRVGGGPWQCVDDADGLVEEVGGLPAKLRTQVNNTMATEAAIAEGIAVWSQWIG